jgi:methionyl aminopeptidase
MTASDIRRVRESCRAARRVLDLAAAAVRPGITTDDLDAIVHDACIAEGGYPSPLNFNGFPKSVCTSVNEVICHGIPDDRRLEDGDIVNIDVTLFLKGFHGDCSATVPVGHVDEASSRLLTIARQCMLKGIAAVHPHGLIRDIGRAVEQHARDAGYSVVRAYCGHGIGRLFHSPPSIPHYYDPKERGKIEPGMVFTVEPMINMGVWEHRMWADRWTAVTADGRRSAQFEHTVLVTRDGPEILTGSTA